MNYYVLIDMIKGQYKSSTLCLSWANHSTVVDEKAIIDIIFYLIINKL